jgi:hypothetical protein
MKKPGRLSILLCLLFLYGCAAAWFGAGLGIGVGAYKYVEGNLIRNYPLTYSEAWDAVNTALANLKISVSNSINEGTHGTIEAVRKDGIKVVIKLKDKGRKVTSIGVRVGIFGNRKDAERIHDEIAAVAGI